MSYLRSRNTAYLFMISLLITMPAAGQKVEPQGDAASRTQAVPPSAQAQIADPNKPQYTARQTYEIHQSVLLQRMLLESLPVLPGEKEKIDVTFADFVRRTMEDKPRPLLIAYHSGVHVMDQDTMLKPEGDTVETLTNEKGADGELHRPRLVDILAEQVESRIRPRLDVVVARWDVLRPPPLDGAFRRLQRALKDPDLGLDAAEKDAIQKKLTGIFDTIPKNDRRPGLIEKYEPDARQRLLADLSAEQAEKVQKTIAFLEADHQEWSKPGHVLEVYADAVGLLENARKAATPAEAKPEPPK